MTAEYAADIVTWRYPEPYDCYDMTGADPAFLINPASGYFALTDGALAGGALAAGRWPAGRWPAGPR